VAEFSTNKIYNAGDVVVDEIRLVSYTGFEINLGKMVADFSIYEDLYSNYLTGSLILSDSMNLVKNVPIIGDEDLYITFYTPGVDSKPRQVKFKVFKISSYVRGTGSTTVTVRLEFASHIAEVSTRMKLNRVMKNMTFSQMVEHVYSDMVKQNAKLPSLTVDKSYGSSTVIVPNWSPLYAINWFAHRAVSIQNKSMADYLFYQTLDGAAFLPLSKLKSAEPICTYKSIPGGFRAESGDRMVESELRNIIKYSVRDLGDKMRETKLGIYGSYMLVHETTTKSYYSGVHSYRNAFKRTPHMNPGPLIPWDNKVQDAYVAQMKYYDKSYFTFNNLEDTNFIDQSLSRQYLLNEMNAMTMVIDVYGDTTLRVGHMINLEFMSQEYTKGKTDFIDSYLSGKYMITGILHNVTEGVHKMTMTISRDSYYEALPDKKEKNLV